MRMNEYEEELYWAAGFFDGEGYVATYTRRSKPGSPLYSYMRFGASQSLGSRESKRPTSQS